MYMLKTMQTAVVKPNRQYYTVPGRCHGDMVFR